MTETALTRAQAFEESENVGRNASANSTIGDVIAQRYDRRDILRGALGVAAIAATVSPLALAAAQSAARAERAQANDTRFHFKEVTAGSDEKHYVAEGYDADILMRWGDPVLAGAPAFDPMKQSAAAQKLQFGYNSDFLGYVPMPGAANPARHGLLVVNHEYTNEELMFPGLPRQDVKPVLFAGMTPELVEIEMAARCSRSSARAASGAWSKAPNMRAASMRTPSWRSPAPPPAMPACRPRPTRAAARCSACSTTARGA